MPAVDRLVAGDADGDGWPEDGDANCGDRGATAFWMVPVNASVPDHYDRRHCLLRLNKTKQIPT